MSNVISKIYEASTKFLEPLRPEDTYRLIVDEAIKLVGANMGSITLLQNGRFIRVYASSPILYKINIRKKGYTYKAFKERKIFIASREENLKAHPASAELLSESIVYIPLSYKKESIGVLTLASQKEEDFSQEEVEILQFFSSLATLAIKKTQLYDETWKALETRDLFISMAAHEFRTPLTTISGYAQLLKSKYASKEISQESLWIDELNNETIRLAKLVNELLEASRIRRGAPLTFNFTEYHMSEITQKAITNFKFNYPDRDIELKNNLSDGSDLIVGDLDKLTQVVSNILDNAAKYSPKETKINMEVTFKPPHIIVCIKDRGKGIDKKNLPKVIERYYKVDNEDQEGIGIGLFLVKNIMDKHHGVIQIQSKLGKGTKVELKFPRVKI